MQNYAGQRPQVAQEYAAHNIKNIAAMVTSNRAMVQFS